MSEWELTFLQRQEMCLGRKAGLSPAQLHQLTGGFNFLQMQEIRRALQAGIPETEVQRYAQPWISNSDMAEIFGCLQRHEPVQTVTAPPPRRRFRIPRIVLMPLLIIPACMAAAVHPQGAAIEPLTLKMQEVTIPCGTVFDPSLYAAVNDASGELILPPTFHAERPENRIALYQLNLNGKKYEKMLTIHVRDTEPPILTLTAGSTKWLLGLPFAWQDFIESASDEVDGDLTQQVQCLDALRPEIGTQEIRYAVRDAAGNEAQAVLQVEVIDPLEQVPSAAPAVLPAALPPVPAQPVDPPAEAPAEAWPQPVQIEESVTEEVTEIGEEVLSGETAVEHHVEP